jgi:hypothetical protein
MSEFTQAATQPEVNQFVKDIFGSDDEEEGTKSGSKGTPKGSGGGDDAALNDSDDDDLFANNQKGHKMKKKDKLLGKGKKLLKKRQQVGDGGDGSVQQKSSAATTEDAPAAVSIPEVSMGSPTTSSKQKKDKKDKKDKKLKKRKAAAADDGDGKKTKRSKTDKQRPSVRGTGSALSRMDDGQDDDNASEGDAYDSGEEVVATADDGKFLADEDDDLLAGVVNEYGADDQNFDDDLRPNNKKKNKAGGGGGGGGGGGNGPRKPLDPFSETLATMKKPKKIDVSENDKQRVATDLLKRMDGACKHDDALFAAGQPAFHKLNLLKKVEEMVGLQAMQGTLLDFDILGVFSEWLSIKSDTSLPSHTVRLAIYKMLDKLPCQNEHLKRKTEGSKRTIGQAIVALLKHKDETKENRVLIKNLVEKWSRGIFNKSSDPRNAAIIGNTELQSVAHQYQERRSASSFAAQAAQSAAQNQSFDQAVRKARDSGDGDLSRARAPYSSGFVYTVRPEGKGALVNKDVAVHDDARNKVLKIMKDGKRGSGAVGRKENPRAMDMAQTGRNKS